VSDFYSTQARSGGSRTGAAAVRHGLLKKLDPAVAERLEFLGTFLRKPASTGSFAPSSPWLARAMVRGCDLRNARTVVEFGPGTGAFTRLILRRIGKQTAFFAMELDGEQARRLQERFPGLPVYHDSAEKIQRYLARHGRKKADYIISGLPWGNMPIKVRDRILDAVLASLAPEGTFTTFAYIHACWLPSALHFRKRLKEHFAEVKTSRIIWRNTPPAFVYRCKLKA
jgi:phosphatidylethanolamine/phosphatidyl-N-methylethanolamine N-methyltransferase